MDLAKIVLIIKELKMLTQAAVQILVYLLKHCNEMAHAKIVLRTIGRQTMEDHAYQ